MPRPLTVFATLGLLRATSFGGPRYFLPLANLFKKRQSFSAIDLIFLARAMWAYSSIPWLSGLTQGDLNP